MRRYRGKSALGSISVADSTDHITLQDFFFDFLSPAFTPLRPQSHLLIAKMIEIHGEVFILNTTVGARLFFRSPNELGHIERILVRLLDIVALVVVVMRFLVSAVAFFAL